MKRHRFNRLLRFVLLYLVFYIMIGVWHWFPWFYTVSLGFLSYQIANNCNQYRNCKGLREQANDRNGRIEEKGGQFMNTLFYAIWLLLLLFYKYFHSTLHQTNVCNFLSIVCIQRRRWFVLIFGRVWILMRKMAIGTDWFRFVWKFILNRDTKRRKNIECVLPYDNWVDCVVLLKHQHSILQSASVVCTSKICN